jgi:hypothetical protein
MARYPTGGKSDALKVQPCFGMLVPAAPERGTGLFEELTSFSPRMKSLARAPDH